MSSYEIEEPKKIYFYRMRWSNADLNDKKELFHIPFNERSKVGNFRFSISGYPCLYTGASLKCCYIESNPNEKENNKKNIEEEIKGFACIKLCNTSALRILNLGIPTFHMGEKNLYASILINLALRLACSLKVQDNKNNRPFHAEYIIPQLLLMSILKKNNTNDGTPYTGLSYTSSHYDFEKSCFIERQKRILELTNYVFPTKQTPGSKADHCENLKSKFEMTKVYNFKHNLEDKFDDLNLQDLENDESLSNLDFVYKKCE